MLLRKPRSRIVQIAGRSGQPAPTDDRPQRGIAPSWSGSCLYDPSVYARENSLSRLRVGHAEERPVQGENEAATSDLYGPRPMGWHVKNFLPERDDIDFTG